MKFRTRAIRRAEVIFAGGETIVDARLKAREHLGLGTVITCDGLVCAVLRGHTLIFWSEAGVEREICGDENEAVERMRALVGHGVAA